MEGFSTYALLFVIITVAQIIIRLLARHRSQLDGHEIDIDYYVDGVSSAFMDDKPMRTFPWWVIEHKLCMVIRNQIVMDLHSDQL